MPYHFRGNRAQNLCRLKDSRTQGLKAFEKPFPACKVNDNWPLFNNFALGKVIKSKTKQQTQ